MPRKSNKLVQFFQEWWGILGLLAFFGIGLFKYYHFGGKLRREHRYTVAEVYDTGWMVKSGKNAYCRFFVNNTQYGVHANADQLAGEQLIGRRFLVEFHPPDPTISELYLNVPIPGDIIEVPANGWEIPPFAVPAEVLE